MHWHLKFLFFFAVWCRGDANTLRMVIGAMYTAVMFVGINNCSTVQPICSIERTVFYRERAAGMYSAMPYAIAQVKKKINELLRKRTKRQGAICSPMLLKFYAFAGGHRDPLRISPSIVLHPHSICHDELPMDCCQVLLVLLCVLLLVPLLHLLWHDDCLNLTKPRSCSHLCCSFLFSFQPLLRLLHPKTG
jgi:hypothetical protein